MYTRLTCSVAVWFYARINSYYTNGERHGVTADEYARAGNSWEAGQIFQQRKILYLLEDKEYLGEKRRINWKPFSTRPGSHENERWLIIHRESRREPWHNLEYPSPLSRSFAPSFSLSLHFSSSVLLDRQALCLFPFPFPCSPTRILESRNGL